MPLHGFEIHQPKTIPEAAEMLAAFGEDGCLYGGGTELLLAMKHDVLRFRHLVDAKVLHDLKRIEKAGDTVQIGASATHYSLERSQVIRQYVPVLAEMESTIANVRVRVAGTIGGNLCFAEPHSDPATLLLALGATVEAEGINGSRQMDLAELIGGAYQNTLAKQELLTWIKVPIPKANQRAAYVRFQVHERPTLGLALVLDTPDGGQTLTRTRVAIGCVSPSPQRSEKAEKLLIGRRADVERRLPEAAEAVADLADLIDDQEGSAEYKRHLIGIFLKRAFLKALS